MGRKVVNVFRNKNSRSLAALVRRHGEVIGAEKFDMINVRYSRSMSLDGFIEKHGELLGKEKYDAMCKNKDSSSIEYLMKKHGGSVGKEKYEMRHTRHDNSSIEYFIKIHGIIEGNKKYIEKNKKVSPIFNELKNKFGEEIANIKYAIYKDTKTADSDIQAIIDDKRKYFIDISRNKSKSLGSVSKQSIRFFKELQIKLDRPLKFGSKKDELKMFDAIKNKIYFYDCVDENSKTIIEFHGSHYHPRRDLSDDEKLIWYSPNGDSYNECHAKDQNKKVFANQNGYHVIEVWDYMVSNKTKIKNTLESVCTELYENQKNNQHC